jgi:hypothetical protein
MIAGDNDTCDKFFAGINDTGEQLPPVTTTPAITLFPSVVDIGQKYPKKHKKFSLVLTTLLIRQCCQYQLA